MPLPTVLAAARQPLDLERKNPLSAVPVNLFFI